MERINKLVIVTSYCLIFLFSTDAFGQHQLKITTNLGNSFDTYKLTILDTNFAELINYKFNTSDTTFNYLFEKSNPRKFAYVQLTGYRGKSINFFTSKRVMLSIDSTCTFYKLETISQEDIDHYKKMTNPPAHTKIKKEYGIFNKESPWMYAIGYTYQKNHLVNLEVRKTGVDISGSHGDGLYAMTLFYAPYIILGGDAEVHPNLQFAPKVGIGCYAVIVNANISYIAYNTNFNKFNPAVVPEIGLSAPFGFLHINYGYNLYVNKIESFNKNNQRITFRFSWYFNPKKVW